MPDVASELQECVVASKETSKKVDILIEEYIKKNRECEILQNVIRWLAITLTVFILVAGIVSGLFVYGYLYSPYMYGSGITQSADTPVTDTGCVSQIIR